MRTSTDIAQDIMRKRAEAGRLMRQLEERLLMEENFPVLQGAGRIQPRAEGTAYDINTLKSFHGSMQKHKEAMQRVKFIIKQCDTGEDIVHTTLDKLTLPMYTFVVQVVLAIDNRK